MNYIEDKNIIVEDPFKLRPGASVTVQVRGLKKLTESWDSSTIYNGTIPGYITSDSINSDVNIPLANISIEYDNVMNESSLTIQPVYSESETVTLNIYYTVNEEFLKVSQSALAEGQDADNLLYYEYITVENGVIYPMALIKMDTDLDDYEQILEMYLDIDSEERGLSYILDGFVSITSQGYLSDNRYVLKKGQETVTVPDAYNAEYLRRYRNDAGVYVKDIQIDNQESQVSDLEFFGIENIDDVVFILTSDGLYGFNKWEDFTEVINENGVEFHWPEITGTDLTYVDDDSLAIADGTTIKKFYLRHDFVLVDKNDNKVWTRESNPDLYVT